MRRNLQRLLSILLSITMIFVICPSSAFAAEGAAALKLDSTEKTIEAGKTEKITATYTGETGSLTWISSDTSIATVSAEEIDSADNTKHTVTITAVKEGEATITVENAAKTLKEKCKVTVKEAFPTITLPETLLLAIGKTGNLTAQYKGKDDAATTAKWVSSNTNVAIVTEADDKSKAKVEAHSAGEADITVTIGSVTATCKVTVTYAIAEINGFRDLEFNYGEMTRELIAEPTFQDKAVAAQSKDKLIWESSDPNIISVTPDTGWSNQAKVTLTGKNPGEATITARSELDPEVKQSYTYEVSGIVLSAEKKEVPENNSTVITMQRFGEVKVNYLIADNWDWSSSNVTIAQAYSSGQDAAQLIGRSTGKATITCKSEDGHYSNTIEITVVSYTASATKASLNNNKLEFSDILSKLNDKCKEETGNPLSYITDVALTSAKQGTLYYGYISPDNTGAGVASSLRYYYSPSSGQNGISNITFIPKSDYNGDIIVRYTGYTTNGISYKGMISSTVNASSGISYSSSNGSIIYFQLSDFNTYSRSVNGHDIASVSFTPPNNRYGMLYHDYKSGTVTSSNVSSNIVYKRVGTPSLDKMCFIPDESYSGTFSISYRGTDTAGNTFRSTIEITLSKSSESASLMYYCKPGERVYFKTADLNDACDDAIDKTLSYVRFRLPSSSSGVLYYDSDTEVTSSEKYYRTGSSNKLIKDISFMADKNYDGTVHIYFTGYSSDDSFDGTITVKVSESAESGTIPYSCKAGERVYFERDDFSDLCYDLTDKEINYVKFTLPSSSRGILYLGNSTKVSSSSSYYYSSSSSRKLSDVNFLADDDFSGTAAIPFTAYNRNGKSFTGTVEITVSGSGSSSPTKPTTTTQTPRTVIYRSDGTGVSFRTMDFTTACAESLKTQLSYIKLSTPDSNSGRLYLNYTSPAQFVSFDANQVYSVNGSPSISQITFVPEAEYNGTISLSYTGTGTGGDTCTGSVSISVSRPSESIHFNDMWKSTWAIPSVEFIRSYGIVEGTGANTFSPTASMKRGDFVLMLHRIFNFPESTANGFRDVPEGSYYAAAINSARSLGIIENSSLFHPDSSLTREDAALYLYNSLMYSRRKSDISPGTYSDLGKFPDAVLVSDDAVEAIASLVNLGVFVGDEYGRLNPTLSLNRAQLAVILHRALTF